MKIVLASASPRRQELLKLIGLNPEIIIPHVDEIIRPGEAPTVFLERVAVAKGIEVYRKKYYSHLLISADTVVLLNNSLIGKPADRTDAFRMLRLLSGQRHEVLTGISLMYQGETRFEISRTAVYFKELTESEIDFYLDHEDYLDKAGAYAIQGRAAIFVERIDGCFFNVMGFPLNLFYRMAEDRGLNLYD
ncbi:MAG: Maf family protein [Candidatus Aminicenantes bacterium]|nr:Maf family protein [Candidatus Aminicenantes bacterium]